MFSELKSWIQRRRAERENKVFLARTIAKRKLQMANLIVELLEMVEKGERAEAAWLSPKGMMLIKMQRVVEDGSGQKRRSGKKAKK